MKKQRQLSVRVLSRAMFSSYQLDLKSTKGPTSRLLMNRLSKMPKALVLEMTIQEKFPVFSCAALAAKKDVFSHLTFEKKMVSFRLALETEETWYWVFLAFFIVYQVNYPLEKTFNVLLINWRCFQIQNFFSQYSLDFQD